jgi:hypothetical protein
MSNEKSIQERIILDQFRKCFKSFPKGKIIKTESPDFIIKTSRKKSVGIELTALPSTSYIVTKKSSLLLTGDLFSSLSGKQEKLLNYRKTLCNEYWLLIHADSIEVNSLNLSEVLSKHSIGNSFHRIFLLALFEGKLWEVPTS